MKNTYWTYMVYWGFIIVFVTNVVAGRWNKNEDENGIFDNRHLTPKSTSGNNQDEVDDRFHGPFHGGELNVDKSADCIACERCSSAGCQDGHHGIQLAAWKWCEYYRHVLICIIIVMAGIFKLAFHHTPFLSDYLPESCALMIIGILSGSFIYYGFNSSDYPFPKFTHTLFFNYLLPPIVLDSAYSLYDRDFLYNIGSIITYAVVGTLFNVFAVGFGLYFLNYISKLTRNLFLKQ